MGIMDWLRSKSQPAPKGWESTDTSGWESHPCALPTDIGITAVKLVWRCPECGRRWRLDRVQVNEGYNNFYGFWTELMSAAPVSDTEMLQLLTTEDDPDATS